MEATHEFLSADDIDFYEKRLAGEYLGLVEITVATLDGSPVGFSGLAEGKLEMLFIDQQHRGRGIGSALLHDAIAKAPGLLLHVNEQNAQAVGFSSTMVSSRWNVQRSMLTVALSDVAPQNGVTL